MQLNEHELERYTRQLSLNQLGESGQHKLKQAKALCVGAGGLGSAVSLYLAAAGVGTLGIIDHDEINLSNLQRQILYNTTQLQEKKALVAKKQLSLLNSEINVQAHAIQLTENNISEIFSQYDIIADCTDNFATRYLINDTCTQLNKAYVYASVSGFQGQCTTFLGKNGPCLRCLFPEFTTHANSVIGVTPGVMGVIQATEIIKWIVGIGDLLHKKLLCVDLLKMTFLQYQYGVNDLTCRTCSSGNVP